MADNSSLPVASGNETFANDDIGGIKYPRPKINWGPDGTANDVDVATGKPLPVQLRGSDGTDRSNLLPVSVSSIAAGTNNIGDVDVASIAAGANLIGKVDVQLAGTVPDTGSGTGGTKTQRVIIDSSQFSPAGATTKAASTSVTRATDEVLGLTVTQAASSTITRPADTTAYASGDLVANSTTAGSVTNLQFTTLARISGGSGVIVGAQIQKSTATATNAAFRLHLFNTAPTYTSAGDNSAISTVVVASAKGYLGYIDITAMVGFSDVCWGSGAPDNSRGGIPYVATAQIIYGLLEARGAYTPGNAEVFTVTVDALQD